MELHCHKNTIHNEQMKEGGWPTPFSYFLECMCKCFVCLRVCAPHLCLVLPEATRGIQSSETGVAVGCNLPYGCWEQNPGSPEEQPVLSLMAEHLPSFWVTLLRPSLRVTSFFVGNKSASLCCILCIRRRALDLSITHRQGTNQEK